MHKHRISRAGVTIGASSCLPWLDSFHADGNQQSAFLRFPNGNTERFTFTRTELARLKRMTERNRFAYLLAVMPELESLWASNVEGKRPGKRRRKTLYVSDNVNSLERRRIAHNLVGQDMEAYGLLFKRRQYATAIDAGLFVGGVWRFSVPVAFVLGDTMAKSTVVK